MEEKIENIEDLQTEIIYLKKRINEYTQKIKELERLLKKNYIDKDEEIQQLKEIEKEKEAILNNLKYRNKKLKEEIAEDEVINNLCFKVLHSYEEMKKEEKIYVENREKFQEINGYIDLTKEELDTKIKERVEQLKKEKDRKVKDKQQELEIEFDEEIFRIKKEKNLEKMKIEEEYDNKMRKLEKNYENAKREKEEVIKYLGFSEFIYKNEKFFKNKIEAYLILHKKLQKKRIFPFFIFSEREYEDIYRHIIMSTNELIKLNNENIELRKIGRR